MLDIKKIIFIFIISVIVGIITNVILPSRELSGVVIGLVNGVAYNYFISKNKKID